MIRPHAEIVDATEDDIMRFYGVEFHSQWVAKAIRKGNLVAGFGGLLEMEPGIWFAFFEVPAHERRRSLYRHIREAFREAKEKGAVMVKAHCSGDIPRAVELMQRLGFVQSDETVNGKVVWNVRL